jgi:hypothetical protein
MFKWFKKKPHVCNFVDRHLLSEVTLYCNIDFQVCKGCGKERIVRVYHRGKDAGKVTIEYLGDEN